MSTARRLVDNPPSVEWIDVRGRSGPVARMRRLLRAEERAALDAPTEYETQDRARRAASAEARRRSSSEDPWLQRPGETDAEHEARTDEMVREAGRRARIRAGRCPDTGRPMTLEAS